MKRGGYINITLTMIIVALAAFNIILSKNDSRLNTVNHYDAIFSKRKGFYNYIFIIDGYEAKFKCEFCPRNNDYFIIGEKFKISTRGYEIVSVATSDGEILKNRRSYNLHAIVLYILAAALTILNIYRYIKHKTY